MNDPQYPVSLPKNQWSKVASSVTTGWIHRKNVLPKYLQTYRVVSLGNPDPTSRAEGAPMFEDFPNKEEINSSDPIDVWVYPIDKAGELRIDV